MMDFLKTNVERTLDRLRITVRDENDEPRSADELTADVMAYLEQCTPEYAQQLLFEIDLAKAIDDAAERIEKKREVKTNQVEAYTLAQLHYLAPGHPVYTKTTDNEYGWALLDYKGGKMVAIRHLEENSDTAVYLREDDYGITWQAYSKDISPWEHD